MNLFFEADRTFRNSLRNHNNSYGKNIITDPYSTQNKMQESWKSEYGQKFAPKDGHKHQMDSNKQQNSPKKDFTKETEKVEETEKENIPTEPSVSPHAVETSAAVQTQSPIKTKIFKELSIQTDEQGDLPESRPETPRFVECSSQMSADDLDPCDRMSVITNHSVKEKPSNAENRTIQSKISSISQQYLAAEDKASFWINLSKRPTTSSTLRQDHTVSSQKPMQLKDYLLAQQSKNSQLPFRLINLPSTEHQTNFNEKRTILNKAHSSQPVVSSLPSKKTHSAPRPTWKSGHQPVKQVQNPVFNKPSSPKAKSKKGYAALSGNAFKTKAKSDFDWIDSLYSRYTSNR